MLSIIVVTASLILIVAFFIRVKKNIIRNLEANESPNKVKTIKEQLIEKQLAELSELKEKNLIGEDEFKERAKRIFEKI